MKYKVRPTLTFVRQVKRILRVYPKLDLTIKNYFLELEAHGIMGNRLVGKPRFWKDRVPMKPYGIGKSGGMRVISYFEQGTDIIVPAMIYLKSEMENPEPEWFVEAAREIAD